MLAVAVEIESPREAEVARVADNLAAQELYRRLGFTVTDRRRAYYRDGCDAWLYFRPPGARAG